MESDGYQRISMNLDGFRGIEMDWDGIRWISMKLDGFRGIKIDWDGWNEMDGGNKNE